MTVREAPTDDLGDAATEHAVNFWMTLLVATLIVSMTAYVLSFALLSQEAPAHRAAISTLHARS